MVGGDVKTLGLLYWMKKIKYTWKHWKTYLIIKCFLSHKLDVENIQVNLIVAKAVKAETKFMSEGTRVHLFTSALLSNTKTWIAYHGLILQKNF